MSQLETVQSVINAWKKKDVETVLSHVSDDIVFFYAIGETPARGKAEMRALLSRLKDHQQDLNWRIKNSAETGNMVMTEGVDEYTNPAGLRVQTPHMTAFEFTNGKISGWRDYFDFGVLKMQEGGQPLPDNVKALIDL